MALSIVSPPRPDTPPSIDIVAVHGLGGDRVQTWTHPKSKAFWLRDFLPQQIPDARVMTFGYNADVAFGQSMAEIVDHAKGLLTSLVDKREESEEIGRPLIFIAHSLGGIVVKQALFQACIESRYQPIRDSTLGIIFLGTPHRGSDKAVYGKVLANVAQFVSHRPPPLLLSALQTNSNVLLRLTADFRFQLPDYQIFSFYEQRPMNGFSSVIVEKQSALLEAAHEEQIPVDTDHSAICKYEAVDDDTYEKVWKRVRRMRGSSRPVNDQVSVSYNKHFEVPHLLSPVFTGREEDLRCLAAAFTPGQPSEHRQQRRFVLYGVGGSGKTQLCIKYVQESRERYWGIFWIDASTDDRIQQCYTDVARNLQVDQDVASVKRYLANTTQTWMMVFDNADDPDLSLHRYLPAGERGNVIVTSRNPGCRSYNTIGCREVGQLSLDDSISLIKQVIHGAASASQETDEKEREIVTALGCLALAVVQAGAYIRETSCTLRDYLEIYDTQKESVLQYLPKYTGTDYQYSVYATWQISVDAIRSREDPTSQHALRLLDLLGFYHYDQIPMEMFHRAWQQSWAGEIPEYVPWHNTVPDFLSYRRAIQLSTSLLSSFSLITRNIDESLKLHPLVHGWCRDRLSEEEQWSGYQRALAVLDNSVEWRFTTDDYRFRRTLVSHIQELLQRSGHRDRLSEEWQMGIWPNLALVLSESGWTAGALELTERVLELQKVKLGEDHPNTLSSMNNLAIQYSDTGRRAEALEISEAVWKLHKNKLGEDHPNTLSSMNNLAIQYSDARRQKEALEISEAVWKLHKNKLGEDHPNTLSSMNNLANRYSDAGRRAEALEISEAVWKLGEDHPNTLSSMNNLAIRFSEAGRQKEALQLTEKVVELRKNKLGEDHPDTLSSMNNLAIDYSKSGRRNEALHLTEKVVELRKNKLGEDHPDTLSSSRLLAYFKEKTEEDLLKSPPEPPPPKWSMSQPRQHRMAKFWRKVRS